MNFKNAERQLARWLEVLTTYNMTIKHRPGSQHRNADALSRNPCKQCGFRVDDLSTNVQALVSIEKPDLSDKQEEKFSLLKIQENDTDLNLVRKWIINSKRPSSEEIQGHSYVVKSLWSQWDNLAIENGILVRALSDGNLKSVVVPFSERRKILQSCHNDRISGHLGIRNTLGRLKPRYYWPGMRKDVKIYIGGCEICNKRKMPLKHKRAPMKICKSGYPMERIAADILGELPTTNDGNKYILVISDYYTKWTEAHAMPNMEASTVAEIVVKEVFSRFGVPATIHSDQGSQFESELFTEMCELLWIQKTRTTPYHPKSDGMVERFNKTLATMLSAYVSDHHNDWDVLLPYVMMAYRSAIHETTGCTPNRLMLGREVSTPLDLIYEPPQIAKTVPRNTWVWELQDRMEEAHRIVQQHSDCEILRQKKFHDRQLSWERFDKGEEVLIYFPTRKPGCSPKFTSYWRGPFQVLKKYTDWTYLVNCGRYGKPQVIHVDRMRKCKSQQLRDELQRDDGDMEEVDTTREAGLVTAAEVELQDTFDQMEEDPVVGSDLSDRPRRNRKAPVWLQDYAQDW